MKLDQKSKAFDSLLKKKGSIEKIVEEFKEDIDSSFDKYIEISYNLFKNKQDSYRKISTITTFIAVLAPILIAQSMLALRITGAGALIISILFNKIMDDRFKEWIRYRRIWANLLTERYEFYYNSGDYEGVEGDELLFTRLEQLLKLQNEGIYAISNNMFEIRPFWLKKGSKKEFEYFYPALVNMYEKYNELVKEKEKFLEKVSKSKKNYFINYVNARFLNQFSWYLKRIVPSKKLLYDVIKPANWKSKREEVGKSEYLSHKRNKNWGMILKILSIAFTILNIYYKDSILETLLIFISTIFSVSSSVLSELDKIGKHRETSLTYLQTLMDLTNVWNEFMQGYEGTNKETAFVKRVEFILTQEKERWRSILSVKSK